MTLLEALGSLTRQLEQKHPLYAIGGAIALGYWGVPRATLDIDLTLWFEPGFTAKTLEALYAIGVTGPDRDLAVADADAKGVVYMEYSGIRLDVFTPSIPYYAAALARRTRVQLPQVGEMWMLSAESLVVFKLLFFRAKDLSDVERLIRVQGAQLDRAAVRGPLVEMVGEEDERVVWLDRQSAD